MKPHDPFPKPPRRRVRSGASDWTLDALEAWADVPATRDEVLERCGEADTTAALLGVPKAWILDLNAYRALRWLYPELATSQEDTKP